MKNYVKPVIEIEEFSLDAEFAGGCGIDAPPMHPNTSTLIEQMMQELNESSEIMAADPSYVPSSISAFLASTAGSGYSLDSVTAALADPMKHGAFVRAVSNSCGGFDQNSSTGSYCNFNFNTSTLQNFT